MLADSACHVLVLLLGYIYPAYACFKALERRKPDGIRLWCEYWLILAVFAVCESVGDQTVYWLPMYNETKVFFVVWLWHPRTQGAPYMYAALLSPLLQRHEVEIDRHLAFAQARFLQFVHSLPQQPQPQPQATGGAYSPRNANEAAAMAFMTAKRQ